MVKEVKELSYGMKTIRQNQRMRLQYTHYNSRSAARISPWTRVILALHTTTSQNHYALRKLICMQTTQQYTVSQKSWSC